MKSKKIFSKKGLIISAGFLILSSIIIGFFIIKKRSSIYTYDVEKDYKYSFQQSNARIFNLSLKNGIISLPENIGDRQTSFLKVNVESTFLGKYFVPSINIIDRSSHTQYFEKGAKGVRYLNVSQFISENESEIKIETHRLSIEDQSVSLVVFDNKDAKNSKILVISPHPDDAEIAAFSFYSNKNSYIITVTAGEAGENKYDELYTNEVKQFLKKGQLRTWNSITVPMLGGIEPEHCLNLGFFDGTLQEMFRHKSEPVKGLFTNVSDINTFRKQNISSLKTGLSGKANWISLVENLEYLLKTIKPDIIVTPYPALDSHSDHKLSSIALFEAIKKSNIKNGDLFLYANHYLLNKYYPYGKTGGIISLPPNFKESVYFNSIYSYTLTPDQQNDKFLCLEANNDLRLDTEWLTSSGSIKNAFDNIKRDIKQGNDNYFNRAVRNNEMFFVIKRSVN